MHKTVHILLSAIFLMSLTLNSGYYVCNSQDTVHMYSSCCAEKKVEKTCCSSSENKSESSLEERCCDKIDLETVIIPAQQENLKKTMEHNHWAFYNNSNLLVRKVSLLQGLLDKPSKIPIFDRSDTYRVLCSYLC